VVNRWVKGKADIMTKILLIDDDPDVGAVFQGTFLDDPSIEYRSVTDGERALDEFKNFRPDIVVLDIFLSGSGTDGYRVLNQMRSTGFTGPIVAITAYHDTDTESQLKNRGFSALLRKPIDPEFLTTFLLGQLV
jgi:two-component system nitrogen regulation response regulator NtrX